MEGCYTVEENINFENFLKVMGVPDDETIQKMIQATKQVRYYHRIYIDNCSLNLSKVTLTENDDGTWTQVSGLKTSNFPLNKEFKVSEKTNYNFG